MHHPLLFMSYQYTIRRHWYAPSGCRLRRSSSPSAARAPANNAPCTIRPAIDRLACSVSTVALVRLFPPELGKLASLVSLVLDSNQLSGIPPDLGNLANLFDLHLASNQFSATGRVRFTNDATIFTPC